MNLFTIFHANLAFSSIPYRHYDWILDNCYWPLLDLVETKSVKTGLEFSGQTLEILNELDPSIINKIQTLAENNLIETVCGGQYQSIGPLMPAKDNIFNYTEGRETFKKVLGEDAKILYLPEQTVSKGVLDLIHKSGFETVFIEWNNIVRFGESGVDRKLLFLSPRLNSLNGSKLRVLWNHSVLFQKVQRYIFGEIEIEDVLDYLNQESNGSKGILCFYGSDLEVFGHFPGNTIQFEKKMSTQRWSRYAALIDRLTQSYEFMLPSQGVMENNINDSVDLGSTAFPIICKKQPKYNPVRWSVCGRGAYQLNRACYHISEKINLLAESESITTEMEKELRKQLAPSWASDYRTFTSEDKWLKANADVNHASQRVQVEVDRVKTDHKLKPNEILVISNGQSSNNVIVEQELRFSPNTVLPGAEAFYILEKTPDSETKINVQWENIHTYPNGYVRSAKVVLQFDEKLPALCRIRFSGQDLKNIAKSVEHEACEFDFETQVKFNMKRGMSIEWLMFKSISKTPLIGTIPHGYFESIDWDADFYSGGAQIDTGTEFYHDLSPIQSVAVSCGPVRSIIEGVVPMGPLSQKKKYYVYHSLPRLELKQSFMIKQMVSAGFRTGIITLLPQSWKRDKLCFMTQNGGQKDEKYILSGQRVTHSEAVKTGVSSRSCLGATGGWTAFSDGEKTVTISRNLMQGHNAPLLRYEEIGNKFFARLYHSMGERDETSMFAFRGLVEEQFAITGAKEDHRNHQSSYLVIQA